MKSLRTVVFWMHLGAGVVAGVVILVMSVTGAALALKPQILNAVEKNVRFVSPPVAGARLGAQALLASVQSARPDARGGPLRGRSSRASRVSVARFSSGRDSPWRSAG